MAWEQVLSPEVMARIQSGVTAGANRGQGGEYFDQATGRAYIPQYATTYNGMDDQTNTLTGFRGYDFDPSKIDGKKSRLNGQTYYDFDASGKRAGEGRFTGLKDHNVMSDVLPLAMLAAPFALTAAGVAGAGAAGGAGYGALGATEPIASIGAAGGMTSAELAALGGGTGGLQTLAPLSTLEVAPNVLPEAMKVGGGLSSLLPAGGAASLVGPALSAGAGLYGAKVAGDAADDQVKAAGDENALLREMFHKNIELSEPFRQGGLQGQNALLTALGLKDGENKGWAMKDFGMDDFQADPGYQFRMDEGLKALERSAAGRGGLLSGRTMKDTMRFSQGLGAQEYGNAFNRFQTNRTNKLNPLQSLAGVGQSVSRDMGGAGMNYAGAAGENMAAGANASAAGRVGAASAINNAIGQGVSQYQGGEYVNRLLNLRERGL